MTSERSERVARAERAGGAASEGVRRGVRRGEAPRQERDPRIDAYIAKAQPFARPILERIRKAVHAGCPDVVETIKWSMPAFEYKGPLVGMAAFKAHCALAFWKASLMKSLPSDVGTDAMGEFGRLESLEDTPSEAQLVKMVKEAVALNDAGVKAKREVKAPKKPLKAPTFMLAAIKKNKKAHATFEAFSPSAQREYIEWVTEAKTDATRNKRLETAVQWMSEGKIRNWKYVR
jgi:uncharacterized protein YdeI (YjbR/CyaY-like superfamily)